MALLDHSTYNDFVLRLEKLNPTTPSQWGKMNAVEMIVHCRKGMELALGKFKLKPNPFFKLFFGKWIKSVVVGDKPFKQNSPTAPEFKLHDKGLDFEKEKKLFLSTLNEFIHLPDNLLDKREHGLFGKMTSHEWRKGQWNHLTHHWKQFGI